MLTPFQPEQPMPRRHDIDTLRVFAFALLILYHVGMVYVAEWATTSKAPIRQNGCSGP